MTSMTRLAPHPPDPQRLRQLSRVMAVACLALITLLPVAVALYWAWADAASLSVHANLPPSAIQGPLRTWQRVAGALITEVPLVLLLIGVGQARRCFRLFATGPVFTDEAVQRLRRFAAWAMASVVAGVLAGSAVSVVLTVGNPATMRHLAVGVGSDQLFLLFFAGVVWLMAGIIGQGQALADENASFV
jgi:hypothetical protein